MRRGIPITPEYSLSRHARPTAPGPQTAIVVGPAGEEIYTDEQGRIKVQFHWQRPDEHSTTGANFDDNSSTWVRVSMPSAGDGWGHQFIPRVGQEVFVNFLENQIDRPIVTGRTFDGSHRNPQFSGSGSLPGNKVLSGIQSKEYQGSQYGELLFDDSSGQVRTKLASEYGKTQLNLGYLTHPRSSGTADGRGEGFELRTDRQGSVRANGVFISADSRNGASGTQLDRGEALGQLESALALAQSLGDTAGHQLADVPETGKNGQTLTSDNSPSGMQNTGHQYHIKEALKAWETGSNTAGTTAGGTQPGQQPLLVMSAPAGVASVAAQSQTQAAGTNLDMIAQRDTNQTSGRRWLHNVGEHISLFVAGVANKIALKLIAATGKVQIQAQSDTVEVSAGKDITHSAGSKLSLVAGNEIVLGSGGGYIRLSGGNIEVHSPGNVTVKGASQSMSSAASSTTTAPSFNQSERYNEAFQLKDEKTGEPLAFMDYQIERTDGGVLEGRTDAQGRALRVNASKSDAIKIYHQD